MKRFVSIMLALMLAFGVCAISASADDAATLKFDANGEFKIMHLTDCQDIYPANTTMLKFIDATLKKYQPDLVVLGGDNTVYDDGMETSIAELVSVFVKNETYFTLVFGNHDHQQDLTDDEQLAFYQQYGGKYCLAYDDEPDLTGTATHALSVMGSKSGKAELMLYMFDSNQYVTVEKFEDEYDCVNPDQIAWYIKTSKKAESENGKVVPALAFQHIVVGEVYEALFHESAVDLGALTPKTGGKMYSFFPRTENILDGFLFEFPCPGYYNHGQFAAMVDRGDVVAIFSGHDHINSYTTELDGIKIINTPGATYHSYGNEITRGMRMITVKESDPRNIETEVVTVSQFAIDNKDFAEDAGIDTFSAGFMLFLGDILLALNEVTKGFSSIISLIFK